MWDEKKIQTSHLWFTLLTIILILILQWLLLSPVTGSAVAEYPGLSLPPGHYQQSTFLELTAPVRGAQVIFTLDGRIPTLSYHHLYSHPIPLQADSPNALSLRTRLHYADGTLGPVRTASYFLGDLPSLPMLALVMEPHDLWDWEHGIYRNFEARGREWERPVNLTFWDEANHVQIEAAAGIRIHGNASRFDAKKSFRLYFRQEYGAKQWNVPLFPGSPHNLFDQLILHAGGQDKISQAKNWTLLRNSLAYRLGNDLVGLAPQTRPILLVINGELWGIYHLTERMNERFLDDYYHNDQIDLLDMPEATFNQGINLEARQHWDAVLNFVATHNLTIPANYAHLESQIDIENFIDYFILQIYAANTDWPHANVLQFRSRTQGGRWQWLFWDFDYGFGHVRHSSADFDMFPFAWGQKTPTTTGRFPFLFEQLLTNQSFEEQFLRRLADLLNTTLAPEAATAVLDELATELRPFIPYETARWSPLEPDTDWEADVAIMRDFVQRRPSFLRQQVLQHFNRQTMKLTVILPATSTGTIFLNGMPLAGMPEQTSTWQGLYFENNEIELTAVPAEGYQFNGWSNQAETATQTTLTLHTDTSLAPTFYR